MTEWRRNRWANPAAYYVFGGLLLLAFTLWAPWLSASRTARVERRADAIAEALLEASHGFTPPYDATQTAAIAGRCFAHAASRGEYVKDLELVTPAGEDVWLCLQNRHYVFQLTSSPPAVDQRPGKNTAPAVEVTAWPRDGIGPGHCVFFYPENATRAYTRNLRAAYAGLEENPPSPAAAHRRPGLGSRRLTPYPGRDNERWLIF